MKKQPENRRREKSDSKAKRIIRLNATVSQEERIPSDVQGSYTGLSADGSAPVQDADDL
jgi:hypothetical protein